MAPNGINLLCFCCYLELLKCLKYQDAHLLLLSLQLCCINQRWALCNNLQFARAQCFHCGIGGRAGCSAAVANRWLAAAQLMVQ